jgi:2-iminoacetate synthase ThiH
MSMVENLKELKAKGMDEFLKNQEERHRCPSCGDVVCVHGGKCYSCSYIKAPIRRNLPTNENKNVKPPHKH